MTEDKIRRVSLDRVSLPLGRIFSAAEEEAALRKKIAAVCRTGERNVLSWQLNKKSLDARDKERPVFVYQLDAVLRGGGAGRPAPPPAPALDELPAKAGAAPAGPRPVIVGAGPAGLFAALLLARAGRRPLLIEQGKRVEERARDVDAFWQKGALNPCSNIQFGEGGAGAFSDGKLTSRGKDPLGREVLRLLVECGADPAIAYWHKPHLGSDRLPAIIARLREKIIARGGAFSFQTQLADLTVRQGALSGLAVRGADGTISEIEARTLILAVGNGARAAYRLLAERNIALQAKPFAVGLRIEQAQTAIDRAQYGDFAGHPLLGAADYALTWRDEPSGRGCYTFCNCPGGYIVNAASEPGGVVTNGVSLASRDSGRANAAIVAQVAPGRDFGRDALSGLEFQEQLERAALALAGGCHALPVMAASAFLGNAAKSALPLCTARSAALREADLRSLFSAELTACLQQALARWDKQLPGFLDQAALAGVESRTSAPLTILRGADRQSINCRGLFPAGEGAGYAGGIVSSAVDGMRAALAALESC